MKHEVTVLVAFLVFCVVASVNAQPTTLSGELPRTPILALYSESVPHASLHAAVYEDGSLVWTPGYRNYSLPPDWQRHDQHTSATLPISVSFTVSRALLTPTEVDELVERIDAHKPLANWGRRGKGEAQSPSFDQVLYFCRGGERFEMRTNFETTMSRALQLLEDPGATPTPVWPDFAEFEADWLMVKGELFRLIEEKSPSAESLGPVLFEFRYRPRCDGVRIE